jgi:hypothetical protein
VGRATGSTVGGAAASPAASAMDGGMGWKATVSSTELGLLRAGGAAGSPLANWFTAAASAVAVG